MMLRRVPRAVILWLCALAALASIAWHARVVTDLSAFMPSAPSARQQLLVDQFRQGIIARLMIVGIEGGSADERARLSRRLAQGLRSRSDFVAVQNGAAEELEADRRYFFENRYLLSPQVTAQRFDEQGLHQAFANTLTELSGGAGLLMKQLLTRDPTGEIAALLESMDGGQQPPSTAGVWSTRDGQRALLLLQTRADGSDLEAQDHAIHVVRDAFNGIPDRLSDTRIQLTGTGVYSVSSRSLIQREVGRLALASLSLVLILLMLVYRSWLLLMLNLLPMLTGALAGIAAVSLCFGEIHGITLAFGTTMIGEAVDYAIYLFVQRPGGAAEKAFWRTLWLGLLTSLAGFLALLGAGFPGLVQLGLYSAAGLIAAVLVTRFVLPRVIPPTLPVTALPRLGTTLDRAMSHAPRIRWAVLLITLALAAFLITSHSPLWNRSISALNPVPVAEQKAGEMLQRDMGATELRYLVILRAPDQEQALQLSERAADALRPLVDQGVLGAYSAASQVLPSESRQRTRQTSLPPPAELKQRLRLALAGLPLRPDHLDGFLADVEQNRTRSLLSRADLDGTAASMLYDSLLVKREHDALALLPLSPALRGGELSDASLTRISRALQAAGMQQAPVVDLLTETNALFDSYLREALIYSGLGALAIVALLMLALRSARRVLQVTLPLACAVVSVVAILHLCAIPLTILHLVGLLLVVAIGSNYALFFAADRQNPADDDHRRTLISLVTANLTIVASFGVLALSSVPVLNILGTTVGLGTVLALVYAASLVPRVTARPQ